MPQSPWRAYFGQMYRDASTRKGPFRHPIVVALTVTSVISIHSASLYLRFTRWYYGNVLVGHLCEEPRYYKTRLRPVLPIDDALAYSLTMAAPPLIVLLIEILVLVVSLDEGDKSDVDDDDASESPSLKGPDLLALRFLHFLAVHIFMIAFVSIFVDVAKIVFDWPRPYFLTEFPFNCNETFVQTHPRRDTISNAERIARLGFPSHRVATMSAAAVLLSMHTVRTLRVLRSSGQLQAIIILVSAMATLCTAASVITSNDNRSEDVVVALIIGTVGAVLMASMLPSKLHPNDTETPHEGMLSPTTIEGLTSVTPMRTAAGLSWHIPRKYPVGTNLNQGSSSTRLPGLPERPRLNRI